MPDTYTTDRFPTEMQTNHLSHFLLTSRLLPALSEAAKRAGSARVVTHTSSARKMGKTVNPEHYKKQEGEGEHLGGHKARWQRYHQTKLANIVFVQALKVRRAGVALLLHAPEGCWGASNPDSSSTSMHRPHPARSAWRACIMEQVCAGSPGGRQARQHHGSVCVPRLGSVAATGDNSGGGRRRRAQRHNEVLPVCRGWRAAAAALHCRARSAARRPLGAPAESPHACAESPHAYAESPLTCWEISGRARTRRNRALSSDPPGLQRFVEALRDLSNASACEWLHRQRTPAICDSASRT